MIFSQHLTTLPGGCYENFMADIDGMHDYIATLPKTWPHDPTPTLIAGDNSITHPAYYQSYCNIVTESEVQDFLFSGAVIDLPTVTEKTYKPFRTRQLPIWLAAPGHLSYLESLGFEVMRDLLPAGFDQSGVFARATMISQIVSKGHAYIKDFYHAHLREIEHNYALVHGTQVDDLITNNIKNFLDQTVT